MIGVETIHATSKKTSKNTRQIVKHVKIPFTSIENADVIWTLRTV